MSNCGVMKCKPKLWQDMGLAGIADMTHVHKRLYLPENYEVLSVEERADIVDVIVSSDAIPDRGEGAIPLLKPIWAWDTATDKIWVDHIEIHKGE